MAPPAVRASGTERGSALLEALPVMAVLLTLGLGILTGGYVLFARVWVQFQAEQALYCAAEGRSGCARGLRGAIEARLPWGRVRGARVWGVEDKWFVEVEWRWNGIRWRERKRLGVRGILARRDSRS